MLFQPLHPEIEFLCGLFINPLVCCLLTICTELSQQSPVLLNLLIVVLTDFAVVVLTVFTFIADWCIRFQEEHIVLRAVHIELLGEVLHWTVFTGAGDSGEQRKVPAGELAVLTLERNLIMFTLVAHMSLIVGIIMSPVLRAESNPSNASPW